MSNSVFNANFTLIPESVFFRVTSIDSNRGLVSSASHVLMGGEVHAHLPARGRIEFSVKNIPNAIDFQVSSNIELNQRHQEDGIFIIESTMTEGDGWAVIKLADVDGNLSENQITVLITISDVMPITAKFVQPRL